MVEDDEYWNFSFTSQLSFDDTSDAVAVNQPEEIPVQNNFTINDLITPANLELILSNPITESSETVEEFVENSIFGIEYNQISKFRQFSEKLQLLDKAIICMNGNLIKYILIFLKRTLNWDLLASVLSKRRLALSHYVQLELENESEWEISLQKLIRSNLMTKVDVMKYFESQMNQIHSLDLRRNTCEVFLNSFNFDDDSIYLSEYVKFLEYGKQLNFLNQDMSVISLLVNLFLDYLKSASNKYVEFSDQFKVSKKQFNWALINVYSNKHCWSSVINKLKVENRFGGPTFNTKDFYAYKVITRLYEYKAPVDVLKAVMPLVKNSNDISSSVKSKCEFVAKL